MLSSRQLLPQPAVAQQNRRIITSSNGLVASRLLPAQRPLVLCAADKKGKKGEENTEAQNARVVEYWLSDADLDIICCILLF